MKEKRETSAFIPYKRTGRGLEFFLQKRDMQATRSPGVFGLFGGGADEGESPEQALIREVQEELTYVPVAFEYFSRYENADTVFYIFLEEVGEDFESKIEVREGEYGKFLTYAEIEAEKVSPTTRLVTEQLVELLGK